MALDRYIHALTRFYTRHRRMPSYGEFLAATGLRSKNAISKIVDKLIEQGLVTKDASGKLAPGTLWGSVRLLGTVEAGWPSPAEEELLDTMTLEEYLIENKEATYMLKVKGDSMIDAGIMPGDMVLVERRSEARDGDIVIAQIDNGWTMKFLKHSGNRVYLMPGNKRFKAIYPTEELKISAVVKAVIRKY